MIDHLLMSIYVLGHLVELLNYAHALRWLQILMMMMSMVCMCMAITMDNVHWTWNIEHGDVGM